MRQNGRRYRIGDFELDPNAGALTRDGQRVAMQDLAVRLLVQLAERGGEVVLREELQQRLWADTTEADFEDGLNTAIRKLRVGLGDDPKLPRYVETVRGRGYRLVAPVSIVTRPAEPDRAVLVPAPVASPDGRAAEPTTPRSGRGWLVSLMGLVTAALVAITVAWLGWHLSAPPPPVVERVFPITTSGLISYCLRTPSTRAGLFFIERRGDQWRLMQASLTGDDPKPAPAPLTSTAVLDASVDGKFLLIGQFTRRGDDMPMYTMPAAGGPPIRIGDVVAQEGAIAPDGTRFAFSREGELFTTDASGRRLHQLVHGDSNVNWPTWSPDGQRLRFTLYSRTVESAAIWEVNADGTNLHPVLPGWSSPATEYFGSWTRDGRYYVFTSRHNGTANAWALRETTTGFGHQDRGPFLLTQGPMAVAGVAASADSRYLYYCGDHAMSEMMEFDPATSRAEAFMPDINPLHAAFSRDGEWIAYVGAGTEGQVWRMRRDGSDRRRLTPKAMSVAFPRWSPDGRRLAFLGHAAGQSQQAWIIDRDGGPMTALAPQWTDVRDPDWSADNRTVVVIHQVPGHNDSYHLALIDSRTMTATDVAGMDDVYGPRFSPSGRYIAAAEGTSEHVLIYDTVTKQHHRVGEGKQFGIPMWAHNEDVVYFQDGGAPGQPLYRARAAGGPVEVAARFDSVLKAGAGAVAFFGMLPNGHVLVGVRHSASDLYGLEMRW